MKFRPGALMLIAPLALTILAGCAMNKSDDEASSSGTSTSRDAADSLEKVSSSIYELIKVKGKASDSRAGVMDCSGKDTKKYFQVFHPWSFHPASAGDLGAAMEQLKTELPKHGWKIVEYGPDSSKNKNINLTADNDEKKVGVHIVQMSKDDPPSLSMNLVSGCYQVPEGEEVQRF
ncbi:hypothetical protein QD712_34460 [Streptomyces acidiscabies]|uniref:hypothetical protein n=1 Tax=Streptomyces acidiscabies TaxID=42234 RepID=UPI0030D51A55